MTSFITIEHSTQHPGVARAESAIDAVKQLRQGFSGTRGLATLLLSAMVAAIIVVADQVMDSVTEGHLLVMWIALWAVAFAALAVFAGAARKLAVRLKAGLDDWSRAVAEARADQRFWAAARADERVMADLQAAFLREESKAEAARAADAVYDDVRAIAAPAGAAERSLRFGSQMLRSYQRNYL
ncbi:hypothetical protein [Polaromonas sp.]|uniref:hypothetical protein n=1 Tax=Polaromonas sp. TaxID=1869339 RepID=UPI00286A3103|nr:hypothetical protein [Polaromonas sp.]